MSAVPNVPPGLAGGSGTERGGREGRHAGTGLVVTGRDLRALLAIASAALLISVLSGGHYALSPLTVLLVVAVSAVSALFPASPAPTAVGVVAVFIVLAGEIGFTGWLVVAASLLHTVHVLAGLAEVVPARARSEAAALVPSLRRWWLAQLLTVPVLLVLVAIID